MTNSTSKTAAPEVPLSHDEQQVLTYEKKAARNLSLKKPDAKYKSAETIIPKLKEWKLYNLGAALEEQVLDPGFAAMPFMARLGLAVVKEDKAREARATSRRFLASGIPEGCYSLENVFFTEDRGIDKATVEEIVEGRWIAKREPHKRRDSRWGGKSIAITGATGCGKTYLSRVICSEVMKRGFTARYAGIREFLDEFATYPSMTAALKKINRFDLIAIDDFGIGTLSEQERNMVFDFIKSRSDHLSTIIISQKDVKEWYGWLGSEYVADSLTDRILHFHFQINLTGKSLRGMDL